MMSKPAMHIRLLNWLVILILVAGCSQSGPGLAPVKGRVTLDGQPIENTMVAFYPNDSKAPSTGYTDKDGNYELAYKQGKLGGMIGENTVKISTSSELVKGANRFHENYNSKSVLKREIKSGSNTIDFELKSDGSST